MKKIFSFSSVAVMAIILMSGCGKDNGQVFRLQIQNFSGEKTAIVEDDLTTVWNEGDVIYINGTDANHIATVQSDYTATLPTPADPINDNFYSLYAGNATNPSFDAAACAYTFTSPASFAYNPEELNAPMAGVCTDESPVINFSNLFALMRLEFVLPPAQVTITSANTALSGEFTVAYTDNGWTITSSPEATESNKVLTITNPEQSNVIFVPVPAGTHQLTFEWNSGNAINTKSMNGAHPIEASVMYPVFCAFAFTVGDDGHQIFFSPGNLQFIGSATPHYWQFAANQWVKLGAAGQVGGGTNNYGRREDVDRDLFAYATSNLPYGNYGPYNPWTAYTNTQLPSVDITDTPLDWGHNEIANGDDKTWRTPTIYEWEYLISNNNGRNSGAVDGVSEIDHPRGGSGFGQAKVHGQNGLVLFPDGYTCPDDIPVNIGWHAVGTASNWHVLTDAQWETLEANGCVFLPATGYVDGYTSASGENTMICYPSSTYDGTSNTRHLVLWGHASTLQTYYNDKNDRGAVRLVRDAH